MRVVVTGASGFIGSHLVTRLLSENQTVVALTHSKLNRTDTGISNLISKEGSIDDVASMVAAFSGCDAVVHLVGIIAETKTKTFEKTVVNGTANLVKAALEAGVKKICYISAVGTSEKADSKYHQAKYKAEQAVINSGLDYLILRPSLVYGLGDGFISLLTKMIRFSPVLPVIGDGRYLLQPVYIDDLVSVITASLTKTDITEKIIEVGGPEKLEYLEILDILKKRLGKRRLNLLLPTWLMSFVAGLLEVILSPAPVTKDQIKMLAVGNTCDITSMRKIFGVEPVNFVQGLKKYI